jgi:hypothetical protein
MEGTLIATGILIIFDLLCLFFYLPPMITEGMLSYIAMFLFIALIVFLAGKVISVMLLKNKRGQLNSATSSSDGVLRNKQFLLSLLGASVLQVIVMLFAPITGSELLYYLFYYATFVGFGIFLSNKCSASHTPLLFSLIVVVVLSIIEFIVFINSSSAIGQLGPERVIFALRDFVGNTSMFFLAASIMWSSWIITRSVKNKVQRNSAASVHR